MKNKNKKKSKYAVQCILGSYRNRNTRRVRVHVCVYVLGSFEPSHMLRLMGVSEPFQEYRVRYTCTSSRMIWHYVLSGTFIVVVDKLKGW